MNPSASSSDVRIFEDQGKYLIGIAYRMLGSLSDAEDMVQECYLRWHKSSERNNIQNPRAYLTRIVVRLCLDRIKAAQARREVYVGPWLPEPVVGNALFTSDQPTNELVNDLSFAVLLVLERLSPLERAAFILHDIFGMDFSEVAQTLGRKEVSCRQLAARARIHVRSNRPRFRASGQDCERLMNSFLQAAQTGDASALARLLADDVIFLSDGGGRVPAALKPINGRDKVLRLLLGLTAKLRLLRDVQIGPRLINGLPGLIFSDASGIFQTFAVEANDNNQVSAIYVVRNPDKLRHLTSNTDDSI